MTVAGAWSAVAAFLLALGTTDLLQSGTRRKRTWSRAALRPGRAVRRIPGVLLGLARSATGNRIAPPASLADRIVAAGRPGGLGPRDWTALKCVTAAGTLAVGVLGAGALPGRLALIAVPAAAAAGFLMPDFWLARVARARADAALRELPGMLDLLRVTIHAGQSPVTAIGLVGERFDGPFAAEWRAVAAQVALGVPRDTALAQIARTLPIGATRAFADTLTTANRAGVSLTGALAAQATAARHERRQQIRERAARAGPKMQLVVALVLVPSVMLVLAALLAAEFTAPGVGLGY